MLTSGLSICTHEMHNTDYTEFKKHSDYTPFKKERQYQKPKYSNPPPVWWISFIVRLLYTCRAYADWHNMIIFSTSRGLWENMTDIFETGNEQQCPLRKTRCINTSQLFPLQPKRSLFVCIPGTEMCLASAQRVADWKVQPPVCTAASQLINSKYSVCGVRECGPSLCGAAWRKATGKSRW